MGDFMSAQQVADHLGVGEKTVRRWIAAGKLEAFLEGHTFRIRLADAEEVFARSAAGRARQRATSAVDDRDREVAALRAQLAEMTGRYREATERLAQAVAERDEAIRRVMRLELEQELRAVRAA